MIFRRLAAFFVDWLLIIGYAALLIPLGLLIADRVADLPAAVLNAGTFVLLILPATVWLAAWERGGRRATPGKRLLGLRVAGPIGWGPALTRNALKLALPWELGHTTVYAFISGANALGIVCAVLAYGLAFTYLGFVLARRRTPYDRVAGTQVELAASA